MVAASSEADGVEPFEEAGWGGDPFLGALKVLERVEPFGTRIGNGKL